MDQRNRDGGGLNFVDPTGGEVDVYAMNNEYVQARQEFDPIFYLIGLGVFVILYWLLNSDNKPKPSKEEQDVINA
jgi:hypothetical protein